MRVCFVGLGSIAKRHIKNLKWILGSSIDITVIRSGKGYEIEEALKSMIFRIVYANDELEDAYDAVFITNPTYLHYNTLLQYIDRSNNFFIEKPVFGTGEEDLAPFLNKGKTYYVACPLRYTNVIQYLKKKIDFSTIYAIRCISSSYLPEWREGVDYRDTYSAHRDMGGGVSIDLIHEWDYIHYLTGSPVQVQSMIRKKSDLQIEADDIAVYIAEYEDKIVELHLDYFGRKPMRKIELFGERDTITADLIEQKIIWQCEGKSVDLCQERDEFQRLELKHFIDIVNHNSETDNGIEDACKILRIARGII